MHTRAIKLKHGPTILVRPLRNGDVATVRAVFEQLATSRAGPASTARSRASPQAELEQLAVVDARITRSSPTSSATRSRSRSRGSRANDRASAEIAFAVADSHQHHGIGSALAAELIADARAAGITEITALAASDNGAALALIRRTADVVDVHFEGPELSIRAAIA